MLFILPLWPCRCSFGGSPCPGLRDSNEDEEFNKKWCRPRSPGVACVLVVVAGQIPKRLKIFGMENLGYFLQAMMYCKTLEVIATVGVPQCIEWSFNAKTTSSSNLMHDSEDKNHRPLDNVLIWHFFCCKN